MSTGTAAGLPAGSPQESSPRLRPHALGFPPLLAQSVALISPTMTAVLIIPLAFGDAGQGTWAAYLFGTIMLLFVVGGHDGLPAGWAPRADLLLSLSAMTFPHELARAMLAEQIYRAFATLRGHPYPR